MSAARRKWRAVPPVTAAKSETLSGTVQSTSSRKTGVGAFFIFLNHKSAAGGERNRIMKIIEHDGSIVESGFEEELGRNALRHTASHILAQAVKRLFPETKLAIGPSIKDGFYYDFDRDTPFQRRISPLLRRK